MIFQGAYNAAAQAAKRGRTELSIREKPKGTCECDVCVSTWIKYEMTHDSDCAVHNMPAMKNGWCNCRIARKTVYPFIVIGIIMIGMMIWFTLYLCGGNF